jgi:ATP-dependent Clp protease protease subunit|tara:strand:- start:1211 stop:1987 length:777 start_codon:yes stop_codon:yes gene_type:complete
MAEWSNATVLKTVVPKGTGGSNPSLSTQFKTKIKNMEYGEDFKKYAMSEHNVSSLNMDYHEKQIKGSLTPYILEEREMRVTQMDIFSRLMRDRVLWVAGGVDDRMSTVVQAQLMYLDSVDNLDITMHIDSPGGSVKSGLSMVDVMQYIKSDIITVNTGMAASMGSVLLGAGTKGKRSSLRFSKTMLHQSSGGAYGNIQDARINFEQWEKVNSILFELLGEFCGKDPKQVTEDASRDFWMDSKEALEYGIIDEIIKSKK